MKQKLKKINFLFRQKFQNLKKKNLDMKNQEKCQRDKRQKRKRSQKGGLFPVVKM